MFADDTNLLYTDSDLKTCISKAEAELDKIKKWFDYNRLYLNEKKTKLMVFGIQRKKSDIKLCLNGTEIERVYETKFLGIILDQEISWGPHIKYVKSKVSKTIGILYKTKTILNAKSLSMLYSTLILPYFSYCAEIWGNGCKTRLDPVIKLQKRAIRLINRSGFREPTSSLFLKSYQLKFLDIVKLKLLKLMYQVVNGSLPESIRSFFQQRRGQYNFRGVFRFEKGKIRTNLKLRCVSSVGIRLWNDLDDKIKLINSLNKFKQSLKYKIINSYK